MQSERTYQWASWQLWFRIFSKMWIQLLALWTCPPREWRHKLNFPTSIPYSDLQIFSEPPLSNCEKGENNKIIFLLPCRVAKSGSTTIGEDVAFCKLKNKHNPPPPYSRKNVVKFSLMNCLVTHVGKSDIRVDILYNMLLLLFVFHSFSFFKQRLFKTEYNRRYTIVGGLFVSDHVIPPGEEFPRKNALVVFFGQFAQTGVRGHSVQ